MRCHSAANFFAWYNNDHCHSGIAYVTPASLHYGRAPVVIEARKTTLDTAYEWRPERFAGGRTTPAKLPTAVWIHPPAKSDNEKGSSEFDCPEDSQVSSLTHPRSDYPSIRLPRDPITPRSDYPSIRLSLCWLRPRRSRICFIGQPQSGKTHTFDHPSHAQKNPGGSEAGPRPHYRASLIGKVCCLIIVDTFRAQRPGSLCMLRLRHDAESHGQKRQQTLPLLRLHHSAETRLAYLLVEIDCG